MSMMIARSWRASPGGCSAWRPSCTVRSVFVNVPVFSGNADAGRIDVGEVRGLGQEDVLHDEHLELRERLARVPRVGIGHRGVLAHDVHAADLAGVHRVHDLDDGQSRLRIERSAPHSDAKRCRTSRVVDALVVRDTPSGSVPRRTRPARCSGRAADAGRCPAGRPGRSASSARSGSARCRCRARAARCPCPTGSSRRARSRTRARLRGSSPPGCRRRPPSPRG